MTNLMPNSQIFEMQTIYDEPTKILMRWNNKLFTPLVNKYSKGDFSMVIYSSCNPLSKFVQEHSFNNDIISKHNSPALAI